MLISCTTASSIHCVSQVNFHHILETHGSHVRLISLLAAFSYHTIQLVNNEYLIISYHSCTWYEQIVFILHVITKLYYYKFWLFQNTYNVMESIAVCYPQCASSLTDLHTKNTLTKRIFHSFLTVFTGFASSSTGGNTASSGRLGFLAASTSTFGFTLSQRFRRRAACTWQQTKHPTLSP